MAISLVIGICAIGLVLGIRIDVNQDDLGTVNNGSLDKSNGTDNIAEAASLTTVFSDAQVSHAKGNCASMAWRLFEKAKPTFDYVSKRPYVDISDDGVITLSKLGNKIPFESCKDVVGKGPEKACPSRATIKVHHDHVFSTLSDLKQLLQAVGVKEALIVGSAGGHSYGPASGNKPEWADQWKNIAEKRAQEMAKKLGLVDKVQTVGKWGDFAGVTIQVTALMKISGLRELRGNGEKCSELDVSPEQVIAAASEILDRNNVQITHDENILLEKFAHNDIPFKPCKMTTKSPKTRSQQFDDCISAVGMRTVSDANNLRAALQDLVDLGEILGVTGLEIFGFTASPSSDASETAKLRSLGAARAEVLVNVIRELGPASTLKDRSGHIAEAMDVCKADGTQDACDAVTGFGKIAVDIRMQTLMNPDVFAR